MTTAMTKNTPVIQNFGESLKGSNAKKSAFINPNTVHKIDLSKDGADFLSVLKAGKKAFDMKPLLLDNLNDKKLRALIYEVIASLPSKPRLFSGAIGKNYVEQTFIAFSYYLLYFKNEIPERLYTDMPMVLLPFKKQDKNIDLSSLGMRAYLRTLIDELYWADIQFLSLSITGNQEPLLHYSYKGKQDVISATNQSDLIEQLLQSLAKQNTCTPALKIPKTFDYNIYKRTNALEIGKKPFFLAKKGDKTKQPLVEFDSLDEVHSYCNKDGFLANLYELWQQKKPISTPAHAFHHENSMHRVGIDWRQGKDITPDEFLTTFGLRGVEFGEWVAQGKNTHDRQDFLNKTYDAFMDLTCVLGLPPTFVGLDGTLGLAFGSRGSGKATAHYEPRNCVINLTKTKGNGALAHEWFHAYDHYVAKTTGAKSFYSKKSTTFTPLIANSYTIATMFERSKRLDKARTKPYFSAPQELCARFFECMIKYKLSQQGHLNEFLVNYSVEPSDTNPYLTDNEITQADIDLFVKQFCLS